ncbi:MAG TPA: potassium-transporting ATPase subunit KdpA, partial [Vicinamibacterales bacterium]|nr:potassium-transporting ATPase subunit KdpA [Vicinamibacterales bacterium]
MTGNGWLQIGVYLLAILAVTPPLGRFMTHVFNRERTWLDPVLGPLERTIYRLTGVSASHEMRWTEYAFAMLAFSVVSMIVLYLMLRTQQWLPWNPQHFAAIPAALAFNTAASFTT